MDEPEAAHESSILQAYKAARDRANRLELELRQATEDHLDPMRITAGRMPTKLYAYYDKWQKPGAARKQWIHGLVPFWKREYAVSAIRRITRKTDEAPKLLVGTITWEEEG